jgi:FkbM family methyltransferase
MRLRKRILNHPAILKLLNKFGVNQYFAQRNEDKIIAGYFGDFKGTLLSVGENNGVLFSNVLYFILRGWSADLVEPSPVVYPKMKKLHRHNDKIGTHQIAIGEQNGMADFYDSGELVDLGDSSLLSTIHFSLTQQHDNVKFNKTQTKVVDFQTFLADVSKYKTYDFISIDAELSDLSILKQMDLTKLGCKCLIIEHADNEDGKKQMIDHCAMHGLSLSHTTIENFIFTRGKSL